MPARLVESRRAASRFAAFVLAFMVLVIVEGAVVRATGSGAGCGNHWPLCNGQVLPHHPRLATVIEFTHRSLTGILSTLVFVLAVWAFLVRPPARRARCAAIWTVVLLLTEALLGAVLVLGGYVERNASNARVLVQGIHFTNTMLLVAALTLTWWWLGDRAELPAWSRADRPAAWLALVATLLTGAAGSVAALADTLFPSTSVLEGLRSDFLPSAPLIVRMRWVHPAAAMIAFACSLWFVARRRTGPAVWFASLMGVQIALGALDILLLAPLWLQVVHLAIADAVWIALVVDCSSLLRVRVPLPEKTAARADASLHA